MFLILRMFEDNDDDTSHNDNKRQHLSLLASVFEESDTMNDVGVVCMSNTYRPRSREALPVFFACLFNFVILQYQKLFL